MEILELLQHEGKYEVRAFDPHVDAEFIIKDMEEATTNSDLILILTDHNEFKELEYEKLENMSTKVIFDTKNVVKNLLE